MRLINVHTYELEEFVGRQVPPYTILSHTWGDGEVSYRDWQSGARSSGRGHDKIMMACEQSRRDGIDHLWVDTNCIDKTSSAELSEAINSMYQWYSQSAICYAYLEDVRVAGSLQEFADSRWFTRGWTLQELLAPEDVRFFSRGWKPVGTRVDNYRLISFITNISEPFLVGRSLLQASVAERMSWAAQRKTSREEDIAYCLLGLFGIHMPIIYGERSGAFLRLQEAILKTHTDQSIFAWEMGDEDFVGYPDGWINFLARSPRAFRHYGSTRPFSITSGNVSITSHGLNANLPILYNSLADCEGASAVALLQCVRSEDSSSGGILGIPLDRVGDRLYRRSGKWKKPILFETKSGPDEPSSPLSALYTSHGGQWFQGVHMARLGIGETAFWQSLKAFRTSLHWSGFLNFHGRLFYRFDDEKWIVRTCAAVDPGLSPTPSPYQAVLCLGRQDLEPVIRLETHVRISPDQAIVERCTMELMVDRHDGSFSDWPRVEEVEVASLPSRAVRLAPEDEPRQVVSVSWGLISVSMSAFWGQKGEPPVIIASIACAQPSPHEEYVRKAMAR